MHCGDAEALAIIDKQVTEFCLTEAARLVRIASKTGLRSPGEPVIARSTTEVAVCCSIASERCPRASARSRVRASSCFFISLSELGVLLTRAFAFVPVERSLRASVVGLLAPLRDKVTSSAQSLAPLCAHCRLRTAQEVLFSLSSAELI